MSYENIIVSNSQQQQHVVLRVPGRSTEFHSTQSIPGIISYVGHVLSTEYIHTTTYLYERVRTIHYTEVRTYLMYKLAISDVLIQQVV